MDATDLERFIKIHGLTAEILFLDVETPTVDAAAEAVGVHARQIGKSLLFLADGEPLLVIANGTTRVDYKRLAGHLGISRKRLKMANAKQVVDITGYPVGTVPPFGHKQRLATLLEQQAMAQDELYAGGGEINALVRVSMDELLQVTGAGVVILQSPADPEPTSA